ncbi:serine/threonine-protein kinase [Xanthomonadaceae bacterium JHOS43]|nr:serine/threonine-protein kinase [Xanthomonadaceae bacterium JHOS43]
MNPTQAALWREADAIFDALLDLPDAERSTRLATLPDALRQRVQNLLDAACGSGPLDVALDLHAKGPAIPTRIGAWTLGEAIGRGGMSVVYAAWRDVAGERQQAALKLLTVAALASDGKQRFLREHQALARLAHPHIAALLDAGVLADGTPYIAMQRIDGVRIDHWCQSRRLSPRAVVELFLQVCEAVAYANRQLVVHRDLKPGNILVDAQGEARLLDFGIARLLDDAIDDEATAQRAMTPQYAAPECFSAADTGAAVDVYGLGAVLYRLLCGHAPHDRSLGRDADIRPPSRASTGPRTARALRGDLDAITMRALETDPSRRYPDATALADDLRRWLQSRPVHAADAGRWYRLRRFVRRHRGAVAATALLAAAIVTGIGSTLWQSRKVAAEAARAEQVKSFLVSLLQSASPEGPDGRMEDTGNVLARGAHQAIARLDGEPALQSELLLLIARLQAELGRFDAALETLDAAEPRLALDPRNLRTRRTETALIRAQVFSGMGNPQAMRDELAQALEFGAEQEGAAGRRTAAYLRLRLAYARSQLGEHESALALLDAADAMISTLRPADPHIQGEAAFYRGQSAMLRDDYTAAWDGFQQARERYRMSGRVDEATDANLLTAMSSLASRMNKHDEAVALAREVVDITRRLYPADHPLLGGKLNVLASVLIDAGQSAEAESYSREALDISRRTLPAGSTRLAASIYNYAMLLALDFGNPARASELLAEARRIASAGYGENDFRTLLIATGQLYAAHESGDATGATRLADDITARIALPEVTETLSLRSELVLLTRVARIRLELRDAREALGLLDHIETDDGAIHASASRNAVVDTLRLRASMMLGQRDAAAAIATRLRADLSDAAASGDSDVAEAYAALGLHALDAGDRVLARSDLGAARAVFGNRPVRPRSARQLEALARALDASGRKQPAGNEPPQR